MTQEELSKIPAQGTEIHSLATRTPQALVEAGLTPQETFASDIIVPRIVLMQGQSPQVHDGKASPGDLFDNLNNEVLAKRGEKLEFIPLVSYKEWLKNKWNQESQQWELCERFRFSAANAGLPREETINGENYRNDMCLKFIVVVLKRLEDLPYEVGFKRTSYYSGRKLSTHFQLCHMKTQPVSKNIFTLEAKAEEWEGKKFMIMDVAKGRETNEQEKDVAEIWTGTLRKNKVSVAGEDAGE